MNVSGITVANVVTWAILAIGFIGSQVITIRLIGQRMNGFDEWRRAHEMDARESVKLMGELKVATEKLALLAAIAEKRLEKLEDK